MSLIVSLKVYIEEVLLVKHTMPRDDVQSSSGSEASDEQEWLNDSNDDEGEQETVQVISLLDDQIFPDAMSMIKHCKDKFGFDFLAVRDRLQLDFYGSIKLINFSEKYKPPKFLSFMMRFY